MTMTAEIERQLVGTIVLTRYNNKTYRIDDIAWDETPMSEFASVRGDVQTYVNYYK